MASGQNANNAPDSAQKLNVNETLLAQFIPMSGIQTEHLRELCRHASILALQRGETLRGESTRAGTIYYVVSGTLRLHGGKAPEETVTGRGKKSRYALLGLEDAHRCASAETPCVLLLVERAKVSTLLIFTQSKIATSKAPHGADAELAGLLLKSGLFSRIPPCNIERLGELVEPVQVNAKQMVVEQDGKGDYYYIIKQGHCDVLRRDEDGEQIRLARLGPGDSFGEEALITASRRNASVRMCDAGTLLRLTRDYFIDLISQPMIQSVSHPRAANLIANGAQWLDVRLQEEFAHDGLDNALSIPLAQIRSRYQELDPNINYITYCNSGQRSQAATFLLNQRGITSSYLALGIARQCPEAQDDVTIRQELPELQEQLARANQALEEALLGKAAADAAEEVGAQETAQRQARNEADERLMRLTVNAQKTSELLACAKEQKRSLEQLVRNAQAVAESRRRQAAAQCEHLQKHAQEQLQTEKQRLEQCYQSASEQLRALDESQHQAELKFTAEQKRLAEQFASAQLEMASEAEKIRTRMAQEKHTSELQAERIHKQHSQQEHELRSKTEAQLRDERARLESEFATTIATQEQARHDLDMAEAARRAAKEDAHRIREQIKAQDDAKRNQAQADQRAELERLQAAHDAAEANLNAARQRLKTVADKKRSLVDDNNITAVPATNKSTLSSEILELNDEVVNADKALQSAEKAQNVAAEAKQQAQDIATATQTKADELRLQLYEEMEEWASEEEKQSQTDIERALKYAAQMQRMQNEKQEKEQQSKDAAQDLFADLQHALDGSLETDPFGDYLHEQLVAEEKARLIKSARMLASEKKQQAQQALSIPASTPNKAF